jgi:hypothetical protein
VASVKHLRALQGFPDDDGVPVQVQDDDKAEEEEKD